MLHPSIHDAYPGGRVEVKGTVSKGRAEGLNVVAHPREQHKQPLYALQRGRDALHENYRNDWLSALLGLLIFMT
jgi:hypothetical protein